MFHFDGHRVTGAGSTQERNLLVEVIVNRNLVLQLEAEAYVVGAATCL